MIFEDDFVDFIELLNSNQVEYMVVGAHALAFSWSATTYRRLRHLDQTQF